MKKIDIKVIVICVLTLTIIGLLVRGPKIKEVERIVEIEKEVIVTDTVEIEVEIPYEIITEVRVPYEVKVLQPRDTITIEKIVNVPVEIIKEVDRIVEVNRPKTNDWYLGMGYEFGSNPFFSGAGSRLIYKTKSELMFGVDLGVRNNITNFETMEGVIKPYIGGVVYIKLNK